MEQIKCRICGKSINIKYRNKDYGVYTHYFSEHIKRKYFCSSCQLSVEDMIEDLKKISKERYLKKHPEYKYFHYLGISRETGLRFYSLKDKLDKDTWDKISDLFYFCGYSSVDDEKDPPDSARGRWVTHAPQKVMERLGWN